MVKHFDMGRRIRLNKEDVEALLKLRPVQPPTPEYVQGLVAQFLRDLLATGKAAMPNGEVVEAFPQEDGVFPAAPVRCISSRRS
jgi:hypothetical protein